MCVCGCLRVSVCVYVCVFVEVLNQSTSETHTSEHWSCFSVLNLPCDKQHNELTKQVFRQRLDGPLLQKTACVTAVDV